ncbi:hypothetical protein QR98_0021140 [Sarcoptes scabiei]|uniref:Uncharacterized protein n=1 Tax=Sarcoptes scabiei TaxID=52283 RepID=A0A131ZZZ6_SARSC|nr:hypothetical protein QR98_0021140 [Sarcoptes scabiei]
MEWNLICYCRSRKNNVLYKNTAVHTETVHIKQSKSLKISFAFGNYQNFLKSNKIQYTKDTCILFG